MASIKQIIWNFDQEMATELEGAVPSEELLAFGYNEAFQFFAAEFPINLDFKNSQNKTLLHFASENNDLDIVQIWISQNAEIDVQDVIQTTPLMLASREGHLTVCSLLIDNGANVNHHDKFSYSPLTYAIDGNHIEVVKLLVARGANLMAKNGYDITDLEHGLVTLDCVPFASLLSTILLKKQLNV